MHHCDCCCSCCRCCHCTLCDGFPVVVPVAGLRLVRRAFVYVSDTGQRQAREECGHRDQATSRISTRRMPGRILKRTSARVQCKCKWAAAARSKREPGAEPPAASTRSSPPADSSPTASGTSHRQQLRPPAPTPAPLLPQREQRLAVNEAMAAGGGAARAAPRTWVWRRGPRRCSRPDQREGEREKEKWRRLYCFFWPAPILNPNTPPVL